MQRHVRPPPRPSAHAAAAAAAVPPPPRRHNHTHKVAGSVCDHAPLSATRHTRTPTPHAHLRRRRRNRRARLVASAVGHSGHALPGGWVEHLGVGEWMAGGHVCRQAGRVKQAVLRGLAEQHAHATTRAAGRLAAAIARHPPLAPRHRWRPPTRRPESSARAPGPCPTAAPAGHRLRRTARPP